MQTSIYWHDYETFGINPSQDKPSQFAGIRTDTDLNIIGEPLMLYCQPIVDQLPSIDACVITGITPQQVAKQGLPEPEFIKIIEQQLAAKGTCGAGYNSIRFDDEITRYTLYRNFHDPYGREWQNDCCRWDIIDMVRLCYALRPETLNWPMTEQGTPSFKLELLTKNNGLTHDAAHDALSDVMATIALAKLIKERQPKLYDYCWQLRDKRFVAKAINVQQNQPLLHVSSKIGANTGCATIVMPLVAHPTNKNAIICVDLCQDVEPLLTLGHQQLRERLYSRKDALGELLPVGLKAIHLNRSPIVLPISMLQPSHAQRLGVNVELAQDRWQTLLSAVQLQEKAQFAFSQEFAPNSDAESALYQGFIPHADQANCSSIRDLGIEALEQQSRQYTFSDWRLEALWLSYRARHIPNLMNAAETEQWHEQIAQKYFNSDEGRSVYQEYMHQLENKKQQETTEKQKQILTELEQWAVKFKQSFAPQGS